MFILESLRLNIATLSLQPGSNYTIPNINITTDKSVQATICINIINNNNNNINYAKIDA